MKLKLIMATLPTYAMMIIGSVISESSLLIYMMFLSVIISSLIISILFIVCVINKPNEVNKTNFYIVFYCLFYLVLCYETCIMTDVEILALPFYAVVFLFGLLIYLTNGKYLMGNINKKYDEWSLNSNSLGNINKKYDEWSLNSNSLGESMAHYSKDINQAIAMESAFR